MTEQLAFENRPLEIPSDLGALVGGHARLTRDLAMDVTAHGFSSSIVAI